MSQIKVNTGEVKAAAGTLRNCNNDLRDAFPAMADAVKSLRGFWEGPAAGAALPPFEKLQKSNAEARYTVLENYVNFLLHLVGEGYEQVESANTSYADAFK